MPGFAIFIERIGLGNNTAPHRHLPPTAAGSNRPYQDTTIHLAVEADVGQRTTIGAPRGGFEFGNDFHGSNFGSPGNRPPRKAGM